LEERAAVESIPLIETEIAHTAPSGLAGEAGARPVPQPDARFVAPQFGIRELFIVTTLLGAYFGLARVIDVWAMVIAFAVFLIVRVTVALDPRWRTPRVRLALDLLAGVLLPIGCLIHDPFVFHEPRARVVGFATIGSQIAALAAWMFVAPLLGARAFGFFAGFLMFGVILAGGIGILMLPVSAVGLVILVGSLGFIPFFTAATYLRHSRTAWSFAPAGNRGRAIWWCGLAAAMAVAIAAWQLADYVPRAWLKPPRSILTPMFDA
jgi:hypothetical protein